MSQLTMFEPEYWTVSELTLYLRDLIESDTNLQDVWVQGEVSNLSNPRSGHLYFTIKDSTSSLRCVMWRNLVRQLSFLPRDGQAIEVHGAINIYEVQGQYQLYADILRPLGEGALFQEFLRLKARLEQEGLFSPERKRPIPQIPERIGIVTSPTGAAIRDILNTLQRRYPNIDVTLAPTSVQGTEAPQGIVSALEALNRIIAPDVIILARGGGSIEDLWAFNDESVARAIAGSSAPVITGIGHETDFTIADFVSDLRAPTPSAAAELATPNRTELSTALSDLTTRIILHLEAILEVHRRKISNLEHSIALHSPITTIHTNRQWLDDLNYRAGATVRQHIRIQRAKLDGAGKHLASLHPQAILKRGFAALSKSDGQLVRSIRQVQRLEQLQATLSDGQLGLSVEEIAASSDDNK